MKGKEKQSGGRGEKIEFIYVRQDVNYFYIVNSKCFFTYFCNHLYARFIDITMASIRTSKDLS